MNSDTVSICLYTNFYMFQILKFAIFYNLCGICTIVSTSMVNYILDSNKEYYFTFEIEQ